MNLREVLRTAALALGFVAGLKLASLTGEHRVAGTVIFSVVWGTGLACYWYLSDRPELPRVAWLRPVFLWGAAVFDVLAVAVIIVLWHHG